MIQITNNDFLKESNPMFQETKKAFNNGQKNRWSEGHYSGVEKISYMFGKSIRKIDAIPDAVENSLSKHFLTDMSEFCYRWHNASGMKSKLKILFSSAIPFAFAVLAFTPFYLYEEINVFSNFHKDSAAIKSFHDAIMSSLSETFYIMMPILQLFLMALFFKVLSFLAKKIP